MARPRQLGQSALCRLQALLTHCPCFRAIELLCLGGLFLLRSVAFNKRLHGTTLCMTSHGVLFCLVRKRHFAMSSFRGRSLPGRRTNLSHALSLVSAFLSSLPRRPIIVRLPVSMAASCASFLLRRRRRISSSVPRVGKRGLVSGFVRGSTRRPLLPRLKVGRTTPIGGGISRRRRSRSGRRSVRSRDCFARALTGVCIGRRECSGTLRVVGGLGLGCPGGGTCFTSRVEFLRGLVVGAGSGWEGYVCCLLSWLYLRLF